jgi:hypothetical protein
MRSVSRVAVRGVAGRSARLAGPPVEGAVLIDPLLYSATFERKE